MKILIATGIYPPQIGGPAQYAKNCAETFRAQGNAVSVLTYRLERFLSTGVRHLLFLFRMLIALPGKDLCIALDTFSVGFPATIAAKILRKRIIIRTGGDFLWEAYVERSGDLVLLRQFYSSAHEKWNRRERAIFRLTRWTLRNANAIVFSTEWQRDIWMVPYGLDPKRVSIIENQYGPKLPEVPLREKSFLAATRPLKWKNLARLEQAFQSIEGKIPGFALDTVSRPYEEFLERIRRSHAVVLVSLGDISPNMILDALRSNTPFICTRENGLMPRIKDIGLFVDPENEAEIAAALERMSDPFQWAMYREKLERFDLIHSWEDICREFLTLS